MKGRIVVLDQINGRGAAALMVNGRLEDLLIDPPEDATPRPEAIYLAKADRPLKGQKGLMLDLGDGQKGFLRNAKGISPSQKMLVQIATQVEEGKAAPVSLKTLFKGRYAIVTPGAKGLNIARSIRDEEERDRLAELAHDAMADADETLGLILRTAAAGTSEQAIQAEIEDLLQTCVEVTSTDPNQQPQLLLDAPNAQFRAWRDWSEPDPDHVFEDENAFEDHAVLDAIDDLGSAFVKLAGPGSMYVEPTRALVAVDVNTAGDFSFAAGLKANLAAAADLPRQLRLRGLGGQITIDFAPMSKKDRRQVEHALKRSFRTDTVDTNIVGWTPMGHLELQRKRERIPLTTLLG